MRSPQIPFWTPSSKRLKSLAVALGFLAPNLLGFLVFLLVPLVASFAMAFTNWDIRLHNIFSEESLRFVGLGNFRRLFAEPDFRQYLGNTLFFMLGIPIGMAGSLGAALLLSRDLRGGQRGLWPWLLSVAILTAAMTMLALAGGGATATLLLIAGLGSTILIGGSAGGTTVYRSIFFSPHFTSGVATYLLWKKMYSPHTGPINAVLQPVLGRLEIWVKAVSADWLQAGATVCAAATAALLLRRVVWLARAWREEEAGSLSVALSAALLVVPAGLAPFWLPTWLPTLIVLASAGVAGLYLAGRLAGGRAYACRPDYGLSTALLPTILTMVGSLACLGLGCLLFRLPTMAAQGLMPPEWLGSYHWAKPALMLMGLWAAIGSNNMLLYLAGLSNISPELYEAADLDGAGAGQRFLHITWPQLAPVTFFILVMSVIGGLQGGFEMARTMTGGGPAGATTTLSYFIYREGFVAGRLGYASAVSWALFLLVFLVTLVNWKFGNRQIDE